MKKTFVPLEKKVIFQNKNHNSLKVGQELSKFSKQQAQKQFESCSRVVQIFTTVPGSPGGCGEKGQQASLTDLA